MSCFTLKTEHLTQHVNYVYHAFSGRWCDADILNQFVHIIQDRLAMDMPLTTQAMRLLIDKPLCLVRLISGYSINDKWVDSSAYLYWHDLASGPCARVFSAYELKTRKKLVLLMPKCRFDASALISEEELSIKALKRPFSFFPTIYPAALAANVLIEEFAGITLETYLCDRNEFVSQDFAFILYQLVKALVCISNAKYWKDKEPRFYLDLKPDNICIRQAKSGALTLKLIDLESLFKPSDEFFTYSRLYLATETSQGDFDQKTQAYAVASLIFYGLDPNLSRDLFAYEKELTTHCESLWLQWREAGRGQLTQNACETLKQQKLLPWAAIMEEALAEDPAKRLTLKELKPKFKKLSQTPMNFAWSRRSPTEHYQLIKEVTPYEIANYSCPCFCGFS